MPPPYRDFLFPLNAFMHILTHEEGEVRYLHYGLFERDGESIAAAQERSTELLLSRLPPPPARLLEVGIGLGTTLARLLRMGYDAVGITPDEKQIAMASVPARCIRFEDVEDTQPYDAIVFQESSQYIDAEALFAKAASLTGRVVVLDEFSLRAGETLHELAPFLAAADRHGFVKEEEIDVSRQAAPTIAYFQPRFEQYRASLIDEVGLTSQQVDELIAGGVKYGGKYAEGVYVYRLLVLVHPSSALRAPSPR